MRQFLASVFNKTWLNQDLVFAVAVIFIHFKTINLDSITNENNKKYSEKWPYISDQSYRIMVIGGAGSGKTNALLNLTNEQDEIDKI